MMKNFTVPTEVQIKIQLTPKIALFTSNRAIVRVYSVASLLILCQNALNHRIADDTVFSLHQTAHLSKHSYIFVDKRMFTEI